jgi:4-diphosphocytidyl-2-C-methyl-D-erythritol kinase
MNWIGFNMENPLTTIQARAYAKINWLLQVGKLRNDGFHELLTLFQTVDLYDELEFGLAADLVLTISGTPSLAVAESNLVLQAARALLKYSGQTQGARIHLHKLIPLGGGLGGGSADAAITLLALNQLWQLQLPDLVLQQLAAQLGSDVPFFLTGGTAWGHDRGTVLTAAADITADYLLLVNPLVAIPTAAVYREFDRLTNLNPPNIIALSNLSRETLFSQICNSLSAPAEMLYPVVTTVITQLKAAGAEAVLLSGSGATVWASFTTAQARTQAQQQLPAEWWVAPVATISRAEYRDSLLKSKILAY